MRLTHLHPRRSVLAAAAGLTAFSAAALAAGLGRAVVTTYLPVVLARIRDSPELIGMVMLVNIAAGFLVPLWIGVWSDRLRARGHSRTMPFILGGGIVTAGGLAALALGTTVGYLALAASAAVAYTGLNAVTTAHRTLIAEAFPEEDRARATGAEELALILGTVVGVGVGGVLVERSSWLPFAAAALVVPLLAVPTVLRMRHREPKIGPPQHRSDRPLAYYARLAARPGVRLVLGAQWLWVLGYAALPAFFVLYAERELGLRPAAAGGLLVAFGAITGLAMLAAGTVRDTSRHLPLLAAGVALLGGGLLAMVPADEIVEALPGLIAAAIGYGIVATIGFPVLTGFIPTGEAGAYTAIYFSVRALAGLVALPAAGWAIALSDDYRMLTVFGGVATLLALIPLAVLGGTAITGWWGGLDRPRRPRARFVAFWTGALVASTALVMGAAFVVAETPLSGTDAAVFRLFNNLGPGPEALDDALISPHFRNYALLVGLSAGAAVIWRRSEAIRSVIMVVASALIAFGLVRLSWAIWDRPRPQEVLDEIVIVDHDWSPFPSFPSGHVAVTVALVLAIGYLFPALRIPLAVVAVTIAATRMAAGAHFPSDVVGGVVLGAVSVVASLATLDHIGLGPERGDTVRGVGLHIGEWLPPRLRAARSASREPGEGGSRADHGGEPS